MVGGGLNGNVRALALDQANQQLYVGGGFSVVDGSSNPGAIMTNIAKYDINANTWSRLGNTYSNRDASSQTYGQNYGTNNYLLTLALDTTNKKLYAGGNFTIIGDIVSQGFGLYDTSNNMWISLSHPQNLVAPISAIVYTFALDTNNNVYIGGSNTTANVNVASGVMAWDTTKDTNLVDSSGIIVHKFTIFKQNNKILKHNNTYYTGII
jgi:hypothetical protein